MVLIGEVLNLIKSWCWNLSSQHQFRDIEPFLFHCLHFGHTLTFFTSADFYVTGFHIFAIPPIITSPTAQSFVAHRIFLFQRLSPARFSYVFKTHITATTPIFHHSGFTVIDWRTCVFRIWTVSRAFTPARRAVWDCCWIPSWIDECYRHQK